MDGEMTGSSSVDNLGGPLVSKKARTENVDARAPAVKELLFSDEEGQIEKVSSCVEDNVKTNAADGFIGFEKCRNRNCRRPKELSGPLVSKKAGTENVEAPAPAVKELLCADDNKPMDVEEKTGSNSVDDLSGLLVSKSVGIQNERALAPAASAVEEGEVKIPSSDIEYDVKAETEDDCEETEGEDCVRNSPYQLWMSVGELPDLMKEKLHDLETVPSCRVDANGQCTCEGYLARDFQYRIFELLAVRVKVPVDNGISPSGYVVLGEDLVHLIYKEAEPAPGSIDDSLLEDYDPCVLLLEGPNIPVEGNDGVSIFASLPPHPDHLLQLATRRTVSAMEGLPVCMYGEYLCISYIAMKRPLLARVDVITYPQESKLEKGKTKVFGMIRARNGLCSGHKAVVVEGGQSDFDPYPTDSLVLKLDCTFPIETRELPDDAPMFDQLLFRKKKNQAVDDIYPGRRITLSRYILSLRKRSFFTLKAQLYGIEAKTNTCYEIANGEEMFQVQCGGVTKKIIYGESGSALVKVAWNIELQPQYRINGDHETQTMIALN